MVKPRGLVVGVVQLARGALCVAPLHGPGWKNRYLLSLSPLALCPRNKRDYVPVPVHASAVTLVVVSGLARHVVLFTCGVVTRSCLQCLVRVHQFLYQCCVLVVVPRLTRFKRVRL